MRTSFQEHLARLKEPDDYFSGVGAEELPTPVNILLFLRLTKQKLQQRDLQNRSHHRFVLIVNLETEGQVHIDHLQLPLRPGEAVLVFPYQFHHYSLSAPDPIRWLICTFEMNALPFLEILRNRIVTSSAPTRVILERLLEQWHRPASALQSAQLQAVLLQLLIALKEDRQRTGTDLPPEPRSNLLRTINRHLSEWRGQPITVEDLANALNMSTTRLRTRFTEHAGVPIGQYIQNYRIHRAIALLRNTQLSIADVANEAGFGSPQAFSRSFKQETGQTPRSIRAGT